MNQLYEALVALLQGIMKIWEFFKGKKTEKHVADIEEKEEDIIKHDKEVDARTEEKIENVELGKGEAEDAEAVSGGLNDYFGRKIK